MTQGCSESNAIRCMKFKIDIKKVKIPARRQNMTINYMLYRYHFMNFTMFLAFRNLQYVQVAYIISLVEFLGGNWYSSMKFRKLFSIYICRSSPHMTCWINISLLIIRISMQLSFFIIIIVRPKVLIFCHCRSCKIIDTNVSGKKFR